MNYLILVGHTRIMVNAFMIQVMVIKWAVAAEITAM